MSSETYLISCPVCGTANRIPASREGQRGRCGHCKTPLPPLYHTPRQLDDQSFEYFIQDYPGPVLVEFWAPT